MKNKLRGINMLPFAGITQNSLNKNSFEQKVLKEYVSSKKFSQMQFRDDVLNKLDAGNWDIDDKLKNRQILKKTSSI